MYRYKYFPTGLEPVKGAPDPARRGVEPHKPVPVRGRRSLAPDLSKSVRVVGRASLTDHDQTVKKTYGNEGTTKPTPRKRPPAKPKDAVQNRTDRTARRPRRVHRTNVRKKAGRGRASK